MKTNSWFPMFAILFNFLAYATILQPIKRGEEGCIPQRFGYTLAMVYDRLCVGYWCGYWRSHLWLPS